MYYSNTIWLFTLLKKTTGSFDFELANFDQQYILK